jgi:hypothetical protein
MASVGFVVCALLVAGCDNAAKKAQEGAKKVASGATEMAKEVAGGAKEVAKEASDAARRLVIKPVEEALPKIEEKIKGLSGESASKAKEMFAGFQKRLEEFRTAAPERWQSLEAGLVKSFDELKKLVGMEK